MQDGIIKGAGDSRYLKSAIPANITHEQLVTLLRAGTLPIDLFGIREEGWQQLGDALNRGNLLDDATCLILELNQEAAVPNDALLKLAIPAGYYAFYILVLSGETPVSDVVIGGIASLSGGEVRTNTNGYAVGLSKSKTVALTISGYMDIQNVTTSVAATGGVFTAVTILVSKIGQLYAVINTSKAIKFSSLTQSVDFCAVGGGGSGGARQAYTLPCGGGGGGSTSNLLNYAAKDGALSITIGAGGTGVSGLNTGLAGKSGGATTISLNSGGVILSAAGGGGGGADTRTSFATSLLIYGGGSANGGKGGNSQYTVYNDQGHTAGFGGENATIREFNDSVRGFLGGGGGNGVSYYGSAGLPYGGICGGGPLGYGGGSAGAGGDNRTSIDGAAGVVSVRWRYA